MTEIEKLYENAGIEPLCQIPDGYCGVKNVYEDFTSEKQIELIKLLAKRPLTLYIGKYKGKYYFGNSNYKSKENDFEEALATRTNDLWKSLTTEEQQQIREILQ